MEEIQLKLEETHLKPDDEQPEDDFSDITLRLLDLSDVDDFMVWATDDEVTKFCTWDTYTSREHALNYIANVVVRHPWHRAICLKNRPIGAISVMANRGNDICRGEIGYVLGSKYWGKGIATRAVKMAAYSIFIEWPHLERLEALVDVENPGSQRVLEKCGFTREGVLRKYFLQKGKARDMACSSKVKVEPGSVDCNLCNGVDRLDQWAVARVLCAIQCDAPKIGH